jgi:hypothetical protein
VPRDVHTNTEHIEIPTQPTKPSVGQRTRGEIKHRYLAFPPQSHCMREGGSCIRHVGLRSRTKPTFPTKSAVDSWPTKAVTERLVRLGFNLSDRPDARLISLCRQNIFVPRGDDEVLQCRRYTPSSGVDITIIWRLISMLHGPRAQLFVRHGIIARRYPQTACRCIKPGR